MRLSGYITLRSTLAHGAFEAGAMVIPFRREPVLQRDMDDEIIYDQVGVLTDSDRMAFREYAKRLLQIAWNSKSERQWTYAQFSDRVMVCSRMTSTLSRFFAMLIKKMGGDVPVCHGDEASFVAALLSSPVAPQILNVLRDPGERLLLIVELQAESRERYSGASETLFDFSGYSAPAPATKVPALPLVPVYSANALRNAYCGRRGAALYVLDHFGWFVDIATLRNLLSGGALQKVGSSDIDVAGRRALLDLMPMYGLYGGAFNQNAMVEGSLKPKKAWPVVAEAAQVLPVHLRDMARQLSMNDIVTLEAYSRREDALQIVGLYLKRPIAIKKAPQGPDEVTHGGMFFERECLVSGTQLYTEASFIHATELQLGAWVSAWKTFERIPYLGGTAQQGNGLADIVWYDERGEEFVSLVDSVLALSDQAQAVLDKYTAHLDAHREELQELLGATTAREDGTTAADLNDWQRAMEQEEQDEL